MLNERIDLRTVTVAGTLDFVQGRPSFYDANFSFQVEGSGNFEGNVLASQLDPGSAGFFHDVTSSIFGGATFTQAKKGMYQFTVPYANVRFNVTSVQAANNVLIAGRWT